MPMREECKHFQSRTYGSGEVARFCILDLAPEAPWRCPEGCARYERRLADVGWTHGGLVEPPLEDEPDEPPGEIEALLDSAEDIVNAVVPESRSEVVGQHKKAGGSAWERAKRRLGRRGPDSTGGEGFGGSRGGSPR